LPKNSAREISKKGKREGIKKKGKNSGKFVDAKIWARNELQYRWQYPKYAHIHRRILFIKK